MGGPTLVHIFYCIRKLQENVFCVFVHAPPESWVLDLVRAVLTPRNMVGAPETLRRCCNIVAPRFLWARLCASRNSRIIFLVAICNFPQWLKISMRGYVIDVPLFLFHPNTVLTPDVSMMGEDDGI